jgi:GAF domain-containing protein
MPRFFEAAIPIAPRLHFRRRAKLIFPWGMFSCMLLLFLFTRWIGISLVPSFIWGVVVGTACLLYETITPHSFIVFYYHRALTLISSDRISHPDLTDLDQVYSIFPEISLTKYRHKLRWLLTLVITLFTWLMVFALRDELIREEPKGGMILLSLFVLYSIIPFAIMALEAMRNVTWGQNIGSWISLLALGGIISALGVWGLTHDQFAALVFGLMALFVLTGLYMNQRLWIGESVIGDLIRQISLRVLDIKDVPDALKEDIPILIGKLLRYDRVSILSKDPNQPKLTIIGTYGDFHRSSVGEIFDHASGGITWRAVDKGNVVVWNDTRLCPYYRSIPDNQEEDDTRAEIAIPITHHGDLYGVLDVQSTKPGLYGPGDVAILQTIAKIIGAAISAYREEQRLIQAGDLWNQLTVSANLTEEELFYTFAKFAEEHLGANNTVYYPLSPTGFPYKKPYTYGFLKQPTLIKEGITNYAGPLVRLIREWEYHPAPVAQQDVKYLDPSTNLPSPFIEREGIESSYFVPIGIRQEPLGALFLNFRMAKRFDTLFNLMIHSFSQAFATITWKNRYRELVYESFGSPAYVVHFKRGSYGLKAGISKEFDDFFHTKRNERVSDVDHGQLKHLTRRVDRFLDEIQFEEELVPPDFWDPEITLKRELVDFINSRPQSLEHERQPNVRLIFDYRIERENPVVKLALYRVVSEAINNAIVHGKATETLVKIQRQSSSIEIKIINDGEPLAEDYLQRSAELTKGILYLFDQLEKGFGAQTLINNGEKGVGVIVQITIPALSSAQVK